MAGVSNKNHINVRKTHCPKGHAYNTENTAYSNNINGSVSRKCKSCVAVSKRRYYLEVRRQKVVKNLDFELHGEFGTRLYRIWGNMKQRCQNVTDKNYPGYGGRGVNVCNDWQEYRSFAKWAKTHGYSDQMTINRIDNDGNYEPSNCEWTTPKQQANNTRRNHMITYLGKTKTLQQWSEEVGIQSATIRHRLKKKWDVQSALNTPVKGIL